MYKSKHNTGAIPKMTNEMRQIFTLIGTSSKHNYSKSYLFHLFENWNSI